MIGCSYGYPFPHSSLEVHIARLPLNTSKTDCQTGDSVTVSCGHCGEPDPELASWLEGQAAERHRERGARELQDEDSQWGTMSVIGFEEIRRMMLGTLLLCSAKQTRPR